MHEKQLRIVYQEKKSSFETLLKRDKSSLIHMKSLQYLTAELFKANNGRSLEVIKEFFVSQENEIYNLNSGNDLAREEHTNNIICN